jgi:hypothetical protein
VFATGFRSGLEKIENRLRDLTGNPNVHGLIIDPADLSCFRPASRIFDHPAESEKARLAFENAGRIAIYDRASERAWVPERISDRLLGYGNAGGLTVFHCNVATTTITAPWSSSSSEKAPLDCSLPEATEGPLAVGNRSFPMRRHRTYLTTHQPFGTATERLMCGLMRKYKNK